MYLTNSLIVKVKKQLHERDNRDYNQLPWLDDSIQQIACEYLRTPEIVNPITYDIEHDKKLINDKNFIIKMSEHVRDHLDECGFVFDDNNGWSRKSIRDELSNKKYGDKIQPVFENKTVQIWKIKGNLIIIYQPTHTDWMNVFICEATIMDELRQRQRDFGLIDWESFFDKNMNTPEPNQNIYQRYRDTYLNSFVNAIWYSINAMVEPETVEPKEIENTDLYDFWCYMKHMRKTWYIKRKDMIRLTKQYLPKVIKYEFKDLIPQINTMSDSEILDLALKIHKSHYPDQDLDISQIECCKLLHEEIPSMLLVEETSIHSDYTRVLSS